MLMTTSEHMRDCNSREVPAIGVLMVGDCLTNE